MAKKYKTVVADPPWPLQRLGGGGKAPPEDFYSVLPVSLIASFRFPCATQSHLYLWVTNRRVDWGYQVASAWGFDIVQMLTWCKPGLGVGRFQCNTEQVLVCRKGKPQGNPFGRTHGTYFNWKRGRHSEKPEGFYDLVEQISPGPYLDMFARRKRLGWDVWGNEVDSDIELDLP